MTCSICLDAVLERENPSERRFGILGNLRGFPLH